MRINVCLSKLNVPSTFGLGSIEFIKKMLERCREDTAYEGIFLNIPDDHVAIVPAAKTHEKLAVAGEAQIFDADFVRLVAAHHRAFFVIPYDHRSLRQTQCKIA